MHQKELKALKPSGRQRRA